MTFGWVCLSICYFHKLYAICNCSSVTFMMTPSNGNIFRVTGPLGGEPPVTGGFPSQRPVTRSFGVFFFICAWTKYWANNRDAGDLIRYGDDYDVTVMLYNVWIGPRRLCCVWIDNFVYLIWIYFTGATCDSGMMPSITPHLWHGDIPRTCPPRAVFHLIRRLVDNANSTPVPLLQKTRSIILQ